MHHKHANPLNNNDLMILDDQYDTEIMLSPRGKRDQGNMPMDDSYYDHYNSVM